MHTINVKNELRMFVLEFECPIFKQSMTLWWKNVDQEMSFSSTAVPSCAQLGHGLLSPASSAEHSYATMETIKFDR